MRRTLPCLSLFVRSNTAEAAVMAASFSRFSTAGSLALFIYLFLILILYIYLYLILFLYLLRWFVYGIDDTLFAMRQDSALLWARSKMGLAM